MSLTVREREGDSDTATKIDYISVIMNNPPYTAAHNPARDATAVPKDIDIVVHNRISTRDTRPGDNRHLARRE